MKEAHELLELLEKKIKIIRVNSYNSWDSFFHRLRVRPRHYEELTHLYFVDCGGYY